MPKFEHDKSETVFTLPDDDNFMTVRQQLEYSQAVSFAAKSDFIPMWQFLVRLVKKGKRKGVKWESDVIKIDVDLDSVQSIKARQVIHWATDQFVTYMNDMDEEVHNPNSSAPQSMRRKAEVQHQKP